MWEDMVTYWAWRGEGVPRPNSPPTKKALYYASVYTHNNMAMTVACVVCDDDVCKRIHEAELMLNISNGLRVSFPAKFHELG